MAERRSWIELINNNYVVFKISYETEEYDVFSQTLYFNEVVEIERLLTETRAQWTLTLQDQTSIVIVQSRNEPFVIVRIVGPRVMLRYTLSNNEASAAQTALSFIDEFWAERNLQRQGQMTMSLMDQMIDRA